MRSIFIAVLFFFIGMVVGVAVTMKDISTKSLSEIQEIQSEWGEDE